MPTITHQEDLNRDLAGAQPRRRPYFWLGPNDICDILFHSYEGVVQRNFGGNIVSRYRFIVQPYVSPGNCFLSEYHFDTSRTLAREILNSLSRSSSPLLHITRTGSGLRTRYRVSPVRLNSRLNTLDSFLENLGTIEQLLGERECRVPGSIYQARASTQSEASNQLEDEFFGRG